ncbi:MAG: hypothetical protein ACI8UO_005095 [Verrucomicrobiales bacterium]|jgi:hypothetical protein
MSNYLKSILIHGLALPGLFIVISLSSGWYGLEKIKAKREVAQKRADELADTTVKINAMEEKLSGRTEQMAYWEERIEGEVVQKITKTLQTIMEDVSPIELRQTGLGRPSGRSALAGNTENQYSRFQISFEGGFEPMQHVLAELEARMPQIVLEEFYVKPSREVSGLSFQVSFVCWTSPEAASSETL